MTILPFLKDPLKSLPNDFDQDPFVPLSVKFEIENLLPCAEIQSSVCYRDHHLAPHDGTLQVSIRVVLEAVVLILGIRFLGSEFFEP